jgi:hypothetical protein
VVMCTPLVGPTSTGDAKIFGFFFFTEYAY